MFFIGSQKNLHFKIRYFLPSSSYFSRKMEQQHTATKTCRGITRAKKPCSRSGTLDENGFCHQHADQAHHVATARPKAAPTVRSPSVRDASQRNPNENDNNAPPSAPQSHEEEHRDHEQDHIEVEIEEDNDEEGEEVPLRSSLPQCSATSRSTRSRCRHLVSFAGERFCPSHGGRQKAPLIPELPQCQAIARNTRKQCSKHISVAGETYCPAHGGLTKGSSKGASAAQHPPSKPKSKLQSDQETNASVPWRSICSTILKYVIEDHPVQCGCGGPAGDGARRCQALRTIRLLLSLASSSSGEDDATSADDNGGPSSSPSSVAHWATLLSDQGQLSSSSIWLLGLYQLVRTTRAAAFGATRRQTTPPARNFDVPPSPSSAQHVPPPPSPIPRPSFPSSGSFRLPSDLDSFLQEFVPLSRQDQSRRAAPQPVSPPPAPF